MYYDIVCPDKNEVEFIEMAKRLGYKGLCFLYEELPRERLHDDKLQISYGLQKKDMVKNRKNTDLVVARDVENPRLCVEKYLPDIIFGTEKAGKKDFMHQRNSGVDHVICELASKKGVGFGFSLEDIMQKDTKILGRIMQNIILFQKFNLKIFICSMAKKPIHMKNPRDIEALFSWLGLKNTKACLRNLHYVVERNRKINDNKLTDGVEVVE